MLPCLANRSRGGIDLQSRAALEGRRSLIDSTAMLFNGSFHLLAMLCWLVLLCAPLPRCSRNQWSEDGPLRLHMADDWGRV